MELKMNEQILFHKRNFYFLLFVIVIYFYFKNKGKKNYHINFIFLN